MKPNCMGSLRCLLVAALLASSLPCSVEAKGYSSGGGRSYSSSRSSSSGGSRSSGSSMGSSRSSSSGSSRSSSSSAGSRASRSGSPDSSSSRSSRGFTSSSGKSYGSGSSSRDESRRSYTSGKSYTSGGAKSEPDSTIFTFDSGAARARKEEASRKSFTEYKDSMARKNSTGSSSPGSSGASVPPRIDEARPASSPSGSGSWSSRGGYIPTRDTIRTRPWRMYETYAPYYSRPVVVYRDSYNSFFWWWLLDRTLDERAHWAYHHRYDMDPARYQALVADNRELESRVQQLEAQQVPRDTNYAPANLDRDLMYSDRQVAQTYSNRPTMAGAVIFWLLAIPTALGVGAFFVWLVFFKRWQVSTA